MPSLDLALAAVLAVLGLVMGSAVTSLSWRLPRQLTWARGRSLCPTCGAALRPADLVPLFSFLLARGRCRHCGARIAWRYPLTELVCAAWAVLLFTRVGLTWAYLPLVFWGFLLVALLWIDIEFQLLPDALTFPGTLLGIAAALLLFGFARGAHEALLGVVVGSGLLGLLAWSWLTFRKIEGMGQGDIKLAAMFGAVLGWKLTLLALFVAAAAGSAWGLGLMARGRGGMKSPLPFGALLVPAAMVVFLWGHAWLRAYLGLIVRR
jgi:leader peptidase (prepilin peptidase)/N-methyltransferase